MQEPSTLNIFISYTAEDQAIAVATSNMLQQILGRYLTEVFLDSGLNGQKDISEITKAALHRADVFLIFRTGVLHPIDEWTGFELGYFEAIQQGKKEASGIRGKVVMLCFEDTPPPYGRTQRNIRLRIDQQLLGEGDDGLKKHIELGGLDELLHFLEELLFAITGETLTERRDVYEAYTRIAPVFIKKVNRESELQ